MSKPVNQNKTDFAALQSEIASAKDSGDRIRAAELEHMLWLNLHHRIAGNAKSKKTRRKAA